MMVTPNYSDGVLELEDLSGAKMRLGREEVEQLILMVNSQHVERWRRPNKDWLNCSYMTHADDCDCRGAGGDR